MLQIEHTKKFSVLSWQPTRLPSTEKQVHAASSIKNFLQTVRAKRIFQETLKEEKAKNAANNILAPFVPTPQLAIDAFCSHFVFKDDVLLDLGCGDGRVLLATSEKIKKGYGVDIQPLPLQRAIELSSPSRHSHLSWILGDFHDQRVVLACQEVSICFLFLLPSVLQELSPFLAKELRSGSRIVCFTFPLPKTMWTPIREVKVEGLSSSGACMLFEYIVTEDIKNRLGGV